MSALLLTAPSKSQLQVRRAQGVEFVKLVLNPYKRYSSKQREAKLRAESALDTLRSVFRRSAHELRGMM